MLQSPLQPLTLFQTCPKKDFKTGDSCENCKIFTNSFFDGTPLVAAFVSLIFCSKSKIKYVGWFLLKKVCRSDRIMLFTHY